MYPGQKYVSWTKIAKKHLVFGPGSLFKSIPSPHVFGGGTNTPKGCFLFNLARIHTIQYFSGFAVFFRRKIVGTKKDARTLYILTSQFWDKIFIHLFFNSALLEGFCFPHTFPSLAGYKICSN